MANIFSRLFTKVNLGKSAESKAASGSGDYAFAKLKALFAVTDWENVNPITQVFDTGFAYITKAKGSAPSELLDIMGLGASEKVFLASIVPELSIDTCISSLRHHIGQHKTGAGIAWTIPLAGISTAAIEQLYTQNSKEKIEMNNNTTIENKAPVSVHNNMIVAVLDRGNSEALMEKARSAGARGGTVINGRGLGPQAEKFLGITIQDEKEIIFVLSEHDKTPAIMQSMNAEFGLGTKAQGLIFCLPVDRVMSLNEF
ncbi:MAG: hypothetical protein LBM77_00190 [Spirochaetaceae bacterium]|nr:hypothetical protein [Spirochaetaceae bacterium]